MNTDSKHGYQIKKTQARIFIPFTDNNGVEQRLSCADTAEITGKHKSTILAHYHNKLEGKDITWRQVAGLEEVISIHHAKKKKVRNQTLQDKLLSEFNRRRLCQS